MNKNVAAFAAPAALALALTTIEYVKIRRIGKEKRALIQENLEKDIAAIHVAADKVVDEIRNGKYDGKRITDVLNGYEFHRMTSRQD